VKPLGVDRPFEGGGGLLGGLAGGNSSVVLEGEGLGGLAGGTSSTDLEGRGGCGGGVSPGLDGKLGGCSSLDLEGSLGGGGSLLDAASRSTKGRVGLELTVTSGILLFIARACDSRFAFSSRARWLAGRMESFAASKVGSSFLGASTEVVLVIEEPVRV
jgi:hypothetical protein